MGSQQSTTTCAADPALLPRIKTCQSLGRQAHRRETRRAAPSVTARKHYITVRSRSKKKLPADVRQRRPPWLLPLSRLAGALCSRVNDPHAGSAEHVSPLYALSSRQRKSGDSCTPHGDRERYSAASASGSAPSSSVSGSGASSTASTAGSDSSDSSAAGSGSTASVSSTSA